MALRENNVIQVSKIDMAEKKMENIEKSYVLRISVKPIRYTVTDRREATTFQNGVSVYVVRFNSKILGVCHVDDTSVVCTTPAASNWTDGKIKGEFIR